MASMIDQKIEEADNQVYVLPTSFSQQRLWFLERLAPSNIAYNVPVAIRIEGALDQQALERSLSEIIGRHEILRTTFATEEGNPVQVIASRRPAAIPVLACEDLSSIAEAERLDVARRVVMAEIQRPFDLGKGPLFRARLFRLNGADHVLTLTLHHIISDGWSMDVLVRELTLLYEQFALGRPAALPDLPIQYADYAVWQREWLKGEALEKQVEYWKERLKGSTPLLEMPLDHPRPPVQTFSGALEVFQLSPEQIAALKAIAQQSGATLFMTLLAAFNVLLHKYTGRDDIVVGTPIANRRRRELHHLIGCFVNTLAPRTDLSGAPSFRQLLGRVRAASLEDYLHQDAPFEVLVEHLRTGWEPSYNPIFQVMFLFQNKPEAPAALQDLRLSYLDIDPQTARFDVSLGMDESGLRGFFEYNIDLFEADTIKRMVGHFKTLLEAIAARPNEPISRLDILTRDERARLLAMSRGEKVEYAKDRCVHRLVEAQAQARPDAIAVVAGEAGISYGELDRRSNQLARRLRALGVGAETPVGICMERSIGWVVALLAIFKAGGGQVLLDPTYPKDRISFMMEDAQVPVLLTQAGLATQLSEHRAQVICPDADAQDLARENDQSLDGGATVDHVAYVVYTSGSTGRPKAVVTTHGSLLNLVFWHHKEFDISAADRATQVARMGFDASVWEMWPYLTAGASLHLLDEETRSSAASLINWYTKEGITISFLPPALSETIIDRPWPPQARLRTLLTGSDKCVAYPAPGLPFTYVNVYGPTEATVIVTKGEVPPALDSDKPPHIGKPLVNAQVYALDTEMQPTALGIPGELHIGGAHLARGYWNRPALTAEKFVPDPFSQRPGQRLYKTGDLAKYQPDGTIQFLGRRDHQVKLRGFRIELGEIEATLCQHPSVQKAVALIREDEPGDKRIVAYVVSAHDDAPADELRALVRTKLPDYMVPAAIVSLKEIPLTPNGKLDRAALPAPDNSKPQSQTVFVPPRTELEQRIATIFQEFLKLPRVGLYDNFFDLGAHSLLIARARDAMQDQFGLEIPIVEIYKNPSISALAQFLGDQAAGATGAASTAAAEAEDDPLKQGLERAQKRRAQRQRRG